MCGICGIVNLDTNIVSQQPVEVMMRRMKHRGPDDEGIFLEGNIGLGFVRLSIIDLSSGGHQPMVSYDNRYVIVFNGEIYNYIEIRKELEGSGYRFRSSSDTEVLLMAFIEWGEKCLEKFNGMWVFAIYDRERHSLFCARDRFGIKPFYYLIDGERFLFASEIPPLLEVLSTKPKPNYQAIYDYLVFNRTDQDESTFFVEVRKLQHGHYFKMDIGNNRSNVIKKGIDPVRWYDLSRNLKEPFKSADEFYNMFLSSVALRMRSDVPVGVCLSGGLDSSSIVSVILKDLGISDIKTFSALYKQGQKGDETEFIEEYKGQIANMHFITPSSESLLADLQPFLRAQAEPIPSTAPYAQFKVMELAHGKVTVTLDGQGADELLAGYHYFFGLYFKNLFTHLNWITLFKEATSYVRNHRSCYGLFASAFFMMPSWLKTIARVKEKAYLNDSFAREYSRKSRIADSLYSANNLQSSLLDHFEYKLEHLLKWEDRNSMWFSIEARLPFLDYRLVERTLSLSPDQIIRSGTTKYILRESMKGLLPEKIRMRQDKIGFDTPQAEWFRSDSLLRFVREILASDSFLNRRLIDSSRTGKMLSKHIRGEKDASKEIWKWIILELWFREFID